LDRVDQRLDEALPFTAQLDLAARGLDAEVADRPLVLGARAVADEPPAGRYRDELGLEQLADLLGRNLLAGPVGLPLHDPRDDRVHPLRQRDAVVALEHECDTALPGLAVDPHDLLVTPPEIARIDGQIGDLPLLGAVLAVVRHRLADRVLVAAGERRVDELAGPRVARMDGHRPAALVDVAHLPP